jgi:NADH-quinone oxidoreductase E subunit
MTSTSMDSFVFDKSNAARVKEHLAKYPKDRKESAVIPLLDMAQRQLGGSLNQSAIEHVGELLGMPPIRVQEVASFYTMLNLKPVGHHHVQVCTTTPCWLRGSDEILDTCKKKLGIDAGVTQDGKFSLIEVECLGACVNAPMVQINDDYYEDLTPASMKKLLEDLAQGQTPQAGPLVHRQTSAPLSGPKTCLSQKKEKSSAR